MDERTESLWGSERLSRAIFDGALDAMLLLDAQGRHVEANPAACALFGLERAQLLGRSVFESVAEPPDAQRVWEVFLERGSLRGSYVMRRPDGALRELEYAATAHILPGVHLSVLRDVTERARLDATLSSSQEALRESEARHRALVESVPDVIWTRDSRGRLLYVSPNIETLSGFTQAEFLREGTALTLSRVHPDDLPKLRDASDALIQRGVAMDLEYRFRHRDERWILVRNRASSVRVVDGVHFIDGVSTDVTEQRSLEEQLRQAHKMEAVGRLAGGVAHDFNNLLSVILSQTASLCEPLAQGDPMRDDLAEVSRAAERAAELTRQLLAFSRQQVLQPQAIDLVRLLRTMEPRLKRRLGGDITLHLSSADGVERALVDPSQIDRAVMDLAENARGAMPDGGELSIGLANATLDEAQGRELGLAAGAYVTLTMTDTGVGMDAATRSRIFEPFFTTRPLGEGGGLGLSTVFGVVKQSGGHVVVDSAPGRGATFTVYLPRTLRAAEQSLAVAVAPSLPRGTETVLLVVDEEPLRNLARRILQRGGYAVLAAHNGGEAFLISEQHAGRVHLLLTDVAMPGVGGLQLAARLQRVRPEMKVLLMSGYASEAQQGTLGASMGFVPRPFTPEALLRRVRAMLDAPAGAEGAG